MNIKIPKYLKNIKNIFFTNKGFTIIELIVVISIIGVLTSVVLTNVSEVREKAYVSAAGTTQRQMTKAVKMYYADMGFYPPDVNRGWDPGLVKPEPWSPDAPFEGGFSTSGANCSDCPSNWQDIVAQNWQGPYLGTWPQFTPWKGKYDYNYWTAANTERNGCGVPAGIYMGVEPDYNNVTGKVPPSAEIKMGQAGFDSNCPNNGEAQMLLAPL
jgi:prepilin-type N-terminal cleavage/methylation domain-containing protein